MSNERNSQPVLQLTIALAEVEALRGKVEQLESEKLQLRTDNASMKKQLQSIRFSSSSKSHHKAAKVMPNRRFQRTGRQRPAAEPGR